MATKRTIKVEDTEHLCGRRLDTVQETYGHDCGCIIKRHWLALEDGDEIMGRAIQYTCSSCGVVETIMIDGTDDDVADYEREGTMITRESAHGAEYGPKRTETEANCPNCREWSIILAEFGFCPVHPCSYVTSERARFEAAFDERTNAC